MKRHSGKALLQRKKNIQKIKTGTIGMAILPLAACGGGGGDAPAPGNNAAPTPTPTPTPQTGSFTLVSTNTYVAANNLDSVFSQPSSSADLIVGGRNGNDVIATGSGDDILIGQGGNDQLTSGAGDDIIEGGSGADLINGGSGFDWIYYEGSPSAVNVNLLTGTGSGGDATGDTISNVEHIFGSAYNDTLTGNNGDNAIAGYKGADTINGGLGFDFLSYIASESGVTVNLSTGTGSGGDAAGDTFTNMEGVIGSDYSDTITGDNNDNEFHGFDGNDVINGLGGNDLIFGGNGSDTLNGDDGIDLISGDSGSDTINGGNGDDVLSGGSGDDILNGDDGSDIIFGDPGSDTIDGGDGDDYLSYASSTNGVNVNLQTNTASSGDAQGDTITNIENLYGSAYNDTLTGDDESNIIVGLNGADNMDGGAGSDYLAYYSSTSGVTINLATQTASGGSAQGDTFTNFENVHGSDFADHITGDANDNILSGFGGTDILIGGAGDDTFYAFQVDSSENDQFDGGDDYDIVRFTGSSTVTPYALNLATLNVSNIESIRMGHGYRESLTFTAQDIIDATDAGNTMDIIGHDTDSVSSSSTWNYVQDVMVEDEIYHQYTSGAATVNIYLEIGSQTGFAKPAASFTETAPNVFEAINNSNSSFSQTHDIADMTATGKDGDDLIGTGLGNDVINGGAGNDSLAGHEGNDQIDGGTGADIIFGGSGDDDIIFDILDTFDGGSGTDSLIISGTGENIDLSTVNAVDMEIIDLTGTGNNQITLVLQDVLDVTDNNNQIIFDGNAGDQVTSAGQGWVQGADQNIGGETYNTYTAGSATLLIDEDITQIIS